MVKFSVYLNRYVFVMSEREGLVVRLKRNLTIYTISVDGADPAERANIYSDLNLRISRILALFVSLDAACLSSEDLRFPLSTL